MEQIIEQSRFLIDQLKAPYRRSFYEQVDWEWRLVGIIGARGVGKTTLLLQDASRFPMDKAIYLSLDDLYFTAHGLRDTVAALLDLGYERFYLDEVHKYPTWSREIKNIYDFFPNAMVVFTGSSIIELRKQQVDLSRRALIFHLPNLSFREYLGLVGVHDQHPVKWEDLLENHEAIALELSRTFKPLLHFQRFLEHGAYPFFLEGEQRYAIRLRQLVQLAIEGDLVSGVEETIQQPQKLKQLLQVVAGSAPFTPNISKLAEKIGLDRQTLLRYLTILHQAELIHLLYPMGKGVNLLQKPAKLYLANTNLAFTLSDTKPDTGALRELFFLNQVSPVLEVNTHPGTDFLVAGKWAVEVGGSGKKRKQIELIPNSLRALDGVATGSPGRVPLWLFGFLY